MLRTRYDPGLEPRRGVILLVVIALLTLFAVVGLSFVLYADAAASSSRIFREAEAQTQADIDPELLFSYFMGQLLYDVPDDETGIYSCLRGHSLARNMYGLNYSKAKGEAAKYEDNDVPFNGTGRLHTMPPKPGKPLPGTYNNPFKADDYKLINYTYFKTDGFLRDPERFGALKLNGLIPEYLPWRTNPSDPNELPGYYAGGFNAPYTYPDLNNLFLAAVKAGAGRVGAAIVPAGVLVPSFHRPWLFGSLTDLTNPNWEDPGGKYKTLRPRPIDMDATRFPYPEDEGGDVKNLIGSPGLVYRDSDGKFKLANNDSIWLDLDFPVMVAPDGRKFKPLFAPLIVDLDNRVNLNVHGNLRGSGQATHASNQGWGPWEVNVERVLDASSVEWQSLFHGAVVQAGRYGTDSVPHSDPSRTSPGPYPRIYAPVDFDASDHGAPSAKLLLPAFPADKGSVSYQCFPSVPRGYTYGADSDSERIHHPNLYDPIQPTRPDRSFALSNLEALLRYRDTGSPALTSELFRLCPDNFSAEKSAGPRRRGLVTVRSFDLDLPGVTPWFWAYFAGGNEYNRLPPTPPNQSAYPSGGTVGLPPFPPALRPNRDSEFGPDRRADRSLTSLRRLDLNRYLPPYPLPGANGLIQDRVQFEVAQRARQYMAAEIFERLWRVTATGNPDLLAPPEKPWFYDANRWDAARALAQLAVNIVDFIDSDDYITPFNWHTDKSSGKRQWVYGTELPRVVLNEAYVQYDNDPDDPLLSENTGSLFNMNVWVELHNPFFADDKLTDGGAAKLYGAVYQVVLCRADQQLRLPDNVKGDPRGSVHQTPARDLAIALFTEDTAVIPPSDKNYRDRGFYVLGPKTKFLNDANPNLPANTPLSPAMVARMRPGESPQNMTILLRRLACPHMPAREDDSKPDYNPYITVDYMEDVPYNDGLLFDDKGKHDGSKPMVERESWGRSQPFAGHKSQRNPQSPLQSPLLVPIIPPQPKHTFLRHNGREWANPQPTPGQTLKLPFDWLVHLDRQLVSPMELLHVSAFKPHELTQTFINSKGEPCKHRAPWFDEDLRDTWLNTPQSHRLYRALEFLGTRNQTAGMMMVSTLSDAGIADPIPHVDETRKFTAQLFGTTASGGTWRIEEGSSLIIDKGQGSGAVPLAELARKDPVPSLPSSEEVVRVKKIEPKSGTNKAEFTADFLKKHRDRFTITPTIVSERIPGKININTVWDRKTLLALCDPQSSNHFTDNQIANAPDNVFARLLAWRTPSGLPDKDDKDHPFHSLATGFYPKTGEQQFPGGSIENTVLCAPGTSGRRLFEVPPGSASHPYLQYELLNKIFNNITVRSNVFAVWITVGFFEVTDDSSRPVKLGAELGRAENRHIRHRMFAIVDRSVLQKNPGPQRQFDPRATPSPGSSTGMVVPYFSIIE